MSHAFFEIRARARPLEILILGLHCAHNTGLHCARRKYCAHHRRNIADSDRAAVPQSRADASLVSSGIDPDDKVSSGTDASLLSSQSPSSVLSLVLLVRRTRRPSAALATAIAPYPQSPRVSRRHPPRGYGFEVARLYAPHPGDGVEHGDFDLGGRGARPVPRAAKLLRDPAAMSPGGYIVTVGLYDREGVCCVRFTCPRSTPPRPHARRRRAPPWPRETAQR
jgi:hypothetical protein